MNEYLFIYFLHLKNALRALTKKLRNPSLISSTNLFALFFFLLSYVTCLSISSFALSRRPPPCPRDLPRAPHFPPPLFASISFCLVKDSEEIEKDLPMLPSRKANEGRNGRECERQETGKETVAHPIREYARIKRAGVPNMLSLSDKITFKATNESS